MPKRIISACVIALMCMTMAAGCDSADQAQSDTEKNDVTLEVWTFFQGNVPGAYYVLLWDSLAEEYGFKAEVKTYSTEFLRDKVEYALACRELPDIFMVEGCENTDYVFESGACIPVTDALKDADFKKEYTVPYEDGECYIIPCFAKSYALTYANSDLLSKVNLDIPTNWQELLAMIEKVNAYNEKNGTDYSSIGMGGKDGVMAKMLYATLLYQTDPDACLTAEGKLSAIPEDVLSEAGGKMEELVALGAFQGNYMEAGNTEAIKNFINDKSVLMLGQSAILFHLIQNMKVDGFEVCEFPGYEEAEHENRLMDIYPGMTPGLCVSSGTEYPDETIDLCLEFARRVNEENVEEYGYINISEKDYQVPEKILEPLGDFLNILEASKEPISYPFSLLSQSELDTWSSTLKEILAGQ